MATTLPDAGLSDSIFDALHYLGSKILRAYVSLATFAQRPTANCMQLDECPDLLKWRPPGVPCVTPSSSTESTQKENVVCIPEESSAHVFEALVAVLLRDHWDVGNNCCIDCVPVVVIIIRDVQLNTAATGIRVTAEYSIGGDELHPVDLPSDATARDFANACFRQTRAEHASQLRILRSGGRIPDDARLHDAEHKMSRTRVPQAAAADAEHKMSRKHVLQAAAEKPPDGVGVDQRVPDVPDSKKRRRRFKCHLMPSDDFVRVGPIDLPGSGYGSIRKEDKALSSRPTLLCLQQHSRRCSHASRSSASD